MRACVCAGVVFCRRPVRRLTHASRQCACVSSISIHLPGTILCVIVTLLIQSGENQCKVCVCTRMTPAVRLRVYLEIDLLCCERTEHRFTLWSVHAFCNQTSEKRLQPADAAASYPPPPPTRRRRVCCQPPTLLPAVQLRQASLSQHQPHECLSTRAMGCTSRLDKTRHSRQVCPSASA